MYKRQDSRITLEKKSKDGDFSGKESVRISRELAEAFLTGGEALRDTEELARELARLRQNGWKPAVLVDYVRYPFVYPTGNVRVTIDTELRTAPFKTNLFDDRALTVPVLDEGEAVLEVKYDAFLPDLVRLAVQTPDRRAGACSKYALCRRFD